jgi:tetratricopeptide (TPR) repeat protein
MRTILACLLAAIGVSSDAADDPQAAARDAASDSIRFDLVRYRDRIEEDGSSSRTLEARVFLRSAAAVAELGQIAVPYVDGLGQVQIEKLVVEKPDGRAVDARNATVEDINPFGITGTSNFADVRIKKVTVPGLEPGDLLSYQFVIRQKPLTPGRIFGEMKLMPALGDPVQSYELDLPRKADVQVRLRDGLGAAWQEVSAPPDRFVRKLALSVARPSPDKTPDKAQVQAWSEPDVTFTNFRTWPEVARWWWELSRGRLSPEATVKAEATTIVGKGTTPRENVVALHRYMTSRIRYLNVSFGIGRMQPRPAADVLANRYGDCKDKHALLAALASALGLDVRPVLVHSQRSDLRDDVPGPQQFDHMISVARLGPEPADWLWLDTTNPLTVPGYLAPSLRDKRALLIEASGEGRIVRTPADPPFVSRTEIELKGSMDAEGKLHARALWRVRSDFEVQVRAAFAATPQDRRAELVRAGFAAEWPEGKVANVSVSDPAEVAEPFRIEFDVESGAPTEREQAWSLWLPLPAFGLPNPERKRVSETDPMEVLPSEYLFKADFDIPEGFTLQAPLSVSVQRSYGSFDSTYRTEGRHISLARTLKLKTKSVPAADMASYGAFYRAVDTDHDQKFAVLGRLTPGPGASARDLHAQGQAAFERKEYGNAAELFAKATEADAKLEDGFNDLGRALREAGQKKEAIGAFSRQIEIAPFHESAYAERAYTLIDLNQWEEAEKDLLKQIEVAPFKAWSYERLGDRRAWQRRFSEAAGYYSRAAAIEPKEAERWVDLASAQQQDGHADDARVALERARALDPPAALKVRAAGIYSAIGDAALAGELAASALPALSERLARLSGEDFGTKDLPWVDRVLDSWRLIGSAALASGDEAKGVRYLSAAWKAGFLPEAGLGLGILRTKQGRLSEALDLLNMVASIPAPEATLRNDIQKRIEDLERLLPQSATRINALMDLRTVRLSCPALKDLSEEVVLLIAPDGQVEKVKGIAPRQPTDLGRQISKIGPLRLPMASPGVGTSKIVRRGLLACSLAMGCAFVLDIPGLGQPGMLVASRPFEVTVVKPQAGAILRRGQTEEAIVVLRYNLKTMQDARVALRVRDQAGRSLLHSPPPTEILKGTGEVPRGDRFVVPQDATRIDVSLEVTFVGGDRALPVPAATFAVQ